MTPNALQSSGVMPGRGSRLGTQMEERMCFGNLPCPLPSAERVFRSPFTLSRLSFLYGKKQEGKGDAGADGWTGCSPTGGRGGSPGSFGPCYPQPSLPSVLEPTLPRMSARQDVHFHEGPNL